MFDRYFEEVLKINPTMASYLGDRSKDGQVQIGITEAFRKRYMSIVKKYEKMVGAAEGIDKELLQFALKNDAMLLNCPAHLMPITSFENPVLECTFMEKNIYPHNVDNALRRHKRYVLVFKACIDNMRRGMAQRIVIPKRICTKAIADIENFLDKREYVIENPGVKLASYLEKVYAPAIRKLVTFMKEEYLPKCRDSIGLCSIPGGKALYRIHLHNHTTTSLGPKDIHQLGLREVKRIKGEFEKLMKSKAIYDDNNTDVMAFIRKVQEDPKNFIQSGKKVMAAFKAKQRELRQTVIKRNFYDNVTPYKIERVPRMLEASSAGAFYLPGNGKGRPGAFYINLRDSKEHPKYTVETLSLHEGEPGHHYQFQYMLDKKLPSHRIFGVESNAYVEGWALYAESLSESKDPLMIFGRLTYEMFRAVRCVVDTGIHYYGWSYEKALDYMRSNIAIKDSELVSELIRYICIPGQATAYKVGEQFFLEQKRKFQGDVKEYHKTVLDNGVLPLSVLERLLKSSRR